MIPVSSRLCAGIIMLFAVLGPLMGSAKVTMRVGCLKTAANLANSRDNARMRYPDVITMPPRGFVILGT